MNAEQMSQVRWLREKNGFTDKGIARHMGLPLGAVQVALAKIESEAAKAKAERLASATPASRGAEAKAPAAAPVAKRSARAKIDIAQAQTMKTAGATLATIAAHFGVSQAAVSRALAKARETRPARSGR